MSTVVDVYITDLLAKLDTMNGHLASMKGNDALGLVSYGLLDGTYGLNKAVRDLNTTIAAMGTGTGAIKGIADNVTSLFGIANTGGIKFVFSGDSATELASIDTSIQSCLVAFQAIRDRLAASGHSVGGAAEALDGHVVTYLGNIASALKAGDDTTVWKAIAALTSQLGTSLAATNASLAEQGEGMTPIASVIAALSAPLQDAADTIADRLALGGEGGTTVADTLLVLGGDISTGADTIADRLATPGDEMVTVGATIAALPVQAAADTIADRLALGGEGGTTVADTLVDKADEIITAIGSGIDWPVGGIEIATEPLLTTLSEVVGSATSDIVTAIGGVPTAIGTQTAGIALGTTALGVISTAIAAGTTALGVISTAIAAGTTAIGGIGTSMGLTVTWLGRLRDVLTRGMIGQGITYEDGELPSDAPPLLLSAIYQEQTVDIHTDGKTDVRIDRHGIPTTLPGE